MTHTHTKTAYIRQPLSRSTFAVLYAYTRKRVQGQGKRKVRAGAGSQLADTSVTPSLLSRGSWGGGGGREGGTRSARRSPAGGGRAGGGVCWGTHCTRQPPGGGGGGGGGGSIGGLTRVHVHLAEGAEALEARLLVGLDRAGDQRLRLDLLGLGLWG